MRIVVRVGGSVVASPLNAPLIGKYVNLLKDLRKQGHEVVTVIGGGSLARQFIQVAADLGLEEARRDWAAIHVSRLWAQLFVLCLGEAGCGTQRYLLQRIWFSSGGNYQDPDSLVIFSALFRLL